MKRFEYLGVIILFCWFGVESAFAHDSCHYGHHYDDGCWSSNHNYRSSNDRQSLGVVSPNATADRRMVEGKITELVYLPGATPESGMVEVRLQSGAGIALVRLAPAGYLRQSGMLLREGETITVKGFPVAGLEGDLIVATEIHQGDKSLNLRDGRGRSAW